MSHCLTTVIRGSAHCSIDSSSSKYSSTGHELAGILLTTPDEIVFMACFVADVLIPDVKDVEIANDEHYFDLVFHQVHRMQSYRESYISSCTVALCLDMSNEVQLSGLASSRSLYSPQFLGPVPVTSVYIHTGSMRPRVCPLMCGRTHSLR
jgi:hypothetical protein